MAYVEAAKSGVKGFANAVKRLAVKDKAFAEELAFMHNIRSEITPNALKSITKDMFDASGKMSKKGKKEVKGLIKEHGLAKNATWDDILQAVKEAKARICASIPKLEMPSEFVNVKKAISRPEVMKVQKMRFSELELPPELANAPRQVTPELPKEYYKALKLDLPKLDFNKR